MLSQKKRRGPAPTGKGTLIGVRLQPTELDLLDSWIEAQPERKLTRPAAIRMLMTMGLSADSYFASAPKNDPAVERLIHLLKERGFLKRDATDAEEDPADPAGALPEQQGPVDAPMVRVAREMKAESKKAKPRRD
ncbi:hypothetical protein [Hansschlegelia sp.]|uniref:hypothetical protein n=1 Tax=Hansschlegelia sp. TaxID=2041892 RepID=UPI002CFA6FFA|nr:hypothetical protein [Hansschlegelia sp.]HVI28858.1 hypothetical protein [Hansschlegelia sp.]